MLRSTLFRFTQIFRNIVGSIDPNGVSASSKLKARLGLEQFEVREVPAQLRWTNALDNHTSGTAGNWEQFTGAGWTPASSAPQSGDTLIFDGERCNDDVTGLSGFGFPDLIPDFDRFELINGYSGTVALAPDGSGGVSVMNLQLGSGAIAQSTAGTGLTVMSLFNWTGGTLNSSTNTAVVNLSGATAIFAPGAGNTLSTGSTIKLAPNATGSAGATATFADGAIAFANSAGLVIDNLSTLTIGANQPQRPQLQFLSTGPNPFGAQNVNIKSGGTLTIFKGDFNSNGLPLTISGGQLIVTGGDSTAKFGGRVDSVNNTGPSIQMNDGAIKLMQGTTLTATNGITLSKENTPTSSASLSTLWNPGFAGAGQSQPDATIVGNLINNGADVGLCSDKTNRLSFGTLFINGTVTWSGGTYRPLTYAPGGNLNFSDRWLSSGEFTINNGAQLAPAAVDATGTLNAQQPAVGQQWRIIESRDKITNNKTPPVAGKWKVILEVDANANVIKRLNLEGIV